MKKIKLKYVLVVVCVLFIATIGIYKSDMFASKHDNWLIKEVRIDVSKIKNSLAIVPKWEEMSISRQFNEVEYNNSKYSSRVTEISDENISKNIGNAILSGYDTYTETTYNKKGDLYSIKTISEKCAIAVKFEEDSKYYVYVNPYYRPETLGDFMESLSLKKNTSFGTVYYNYLDEDSQENIKVEFYNVDNEIIWQKLFSNLNLENIYSDNETGKYTSEKLTQSISISVNIPILGYKNISVTLTDKGYLLTNILDTGKGFYIGKIKYKIFLNYIKENYDGYKIVYIYENSKEITDKEEKIMMTENTAKGYVTKEVNTEQIR